MTGFCNHCKSVFLAIRGQEPDKDCPVCWNPLSWAKNSHSTGFEPGAIITTTTNSTSYNPVLASITTKKYGAVGYSQRMNKLEPYDHILFLCNKCGLIFEVRYDVAIHRRQRCPDLKCTNGRSRI